jgi:GTPase SAR1 family protein
MESFNIAVIGATGVGKSSFVQRVLGLSRPSMSNASTVRMVVDNVTHGITLLELDLEYFELTPTAPIQWPKQVNGHIVPRVDAALLIYDVMNEDSIRDLPQTLGEPSPILLSQDLCSANQGKPPLQTRICLPYLWPTSASSPMTSGKLMLMPLPIMNTLNLA